MKNRIVMLGIVVLASALVAGCKGKASNPLTVEQLADLMEFHAWTLPIPQSQQPVKKVRLVIVRHDGSEVPRFEIGDLRSASCTPCPFIQLGLRVEEGVFAGQFYLRDSKGQFESSRISFKDEFASPAGQGESGKSVGWVTTGATPIWNGNRAQLASEWKMGEKRDSILYLELVK